VSARKVGVCLDRALYINRHFDNLGRIALILIVHGRKIAVIETM
jgi:hypothetical protein